MEIMRKAICVGVAMLAITGVSCGDMARQSRASSFLVIDSLLGIRGAATVGAPASVLNSDVITNITSPAPCSPTSPCPTVFGDPGQVTMHADMKDPGTGSTPNTPGPLNAITVNRYHVEYERADGRNTPGVDVPFPFDGAVTATITGAPSTFGFDLVRIVAKEEAPLVELIASHQFITTLAHVTFFGQDQAGNATSVTGTIQVDFGNYGDF
jgi:hypothetical protein